MSVCNGRGDCIKQCGCGCYDDEECEVPSAVCTCGHRDHAKLVGGPNVETDVYCKPDCVHNCQLVECHNYKFCGIKLPQWVLDCHRGMCSDCAVNYGRIKFLTVKDDCPVCLVNKDMIEISCEKHKICLECWQQWSETSNQIPLTCPLCRESIWKR